MPWRLRSTLQRVAAQTPEMKVSKVHLRDSLRLLECDYIEYFVSDKHQFDSGTSRNVARDGFSLECQFQHVLPRASGPNLQSVAGSTVYLDRDNDRVLSKRLRIKSRPRLLMDGIWFIEPFPELFGQMRGKWREKQHQSLRRPMPLRLGQVAPHAR